MRTPASLLLILAPLVTPTLGADLRLDPRIVSAEADRVAVVAQVTPATIAVFDNKGEGGGSGVIIREDGLAVTNFHVVAPCGPFMTCGLPDGALTPAVLLGVDPPGDVAVIRLLDDRRYPVARIGDSDRASVGEEVYVVGNPFLLAEDLKPTVTHGVLSGVRRYQYPANTILEYADCLQTDAAINPGNSGGPLYNHRGELIGVNGRASFEKRGRVNVGVGYAISINQVMRFVSHLEGGRIVDHGALGATVLTLPRGRVVIDRVDLDSDAYRRGLRVSDQVVNVEGREITSANEVQNIVATHPPGSRLRVQCVRPGGEVYEASIRLAGSHSLGELEAVVDEQVAKLEGAAPVADVYEGRPGFVNYLANEARRDQILHACPQRQEAGPDIPWRLTGRDASRGVVSLRLATERASYATDRAEYWIDPHAALGLQRDPPGSGGMLAALSLWRTLLTAGPDALQDCFYLGVLPRGGPPEPLECVAANHNGAYCEFYFTPTECSLRRIEFFADGSADPCVLEFEWDAAGSGRTLSTLSVSRPGEPWLRLEGVRIATEEAAP